MDPEKDAKLKASAEALAFHVFGAFTQLNQVNNSLAGFHAGVRSVEQSKLILTSVIIEIFSVGA
jgi:hypothetical protein